MSSLEKRHTSRRGSMQGHRKYSDGFSDTSSVGSFMDETDREVSNLTDRAFRSLCIGEEAIYNDSEISSPTECHNAFEKEVQQKEVLKTTCQEAFPYCIQYREAERRSEVTSTFQNSYVDVAQEQVLRDECMSYMSNGSIEAMWQQRRSASRVSSLIKAFSSKEGYCDSGTPDSILQSDKYRDFSNGSWDKSALINIQRELSNFSSAYHPFQSYRNHFHTSAAGITRMDTTASHGKSSNTKFHALNSTNFFFHSEFSPFRLWKDYNRFSFEREKPSGFVSASEFPRWYDSPLYKELTAPHTFLNEGGCLNRRRIEDVVPTQRSRSTVIQKASAIEKRCESEMASNCPPWRMNYNFARSKLPNNRPSTVSPTCEKTHRPDSSLLSHGRHTYDVQTKAEKVGGNELPSSSTPFNITQLLTPVIHGRQETETSEILQYAHMPAVPDHSVQDEIDLKSLTDVKQQRDSYKSKASSLLFNIKDNRKRVKSKYSPSKFKGLEIADQNTQPSKLEDCKSQTISDSVVTQEHSTVPNNWELGDVGQQKYEVCRSQNVEHKEYADGYDNDDMTLVSQYGADTYRISHKGSQGSSLHPDKHANTESFEYEFSPHVLSAQKDDGNSEGHNYDPGGTLNPTRPEIENILPTVHLPAHSLLAQMSEKQTFSRREDMRYHDCKETQNFARNPTFEYDKHKVTEQKRSWQNPEPINITNKEMLHNIGLKDSLPFKGEIAALLEMDKQRRITAKQDLPSTNDYSTGKESYINKVNENIKQGRRAKDEDMRDTDASSQKYAYTSKLAQYYPTDISSTSQNLYGLCSAQNDGLHKITSSPPKESNLSRNSEMRKTTHDKLEVSLQRDVKYATSDIIAKKDYNQEIQCSASLEEKQRKNEGSVAYQPYKYELNKQWHLTATDNRPTMDEVPILRQLQAEKTSKQFMVPKQIYPTKKEDIMTDIKKLNIQSTELNNSSQAREDKFSINDILSIRDNEQAKRIRENKHSLPASISDPIKLETQASSVISGIAKEEVKIKQTTKDPTFCENTENTDMLHDYIRKDSHNPNEGLVNASIFMKDMPRKETVRVKENDKITPRTLSYKERGQTKQEILTSKLKAHAQKEISAIKEKGLAKQNILSRNLIKQMTPVNNEKGQMVQEVVSPKKEITAEKLNHLFQDITYSSVTLYKEHRNQDKDDPNYEPLTVEERKVISPQVKYNKAMKDVKITTNEKENTNVKPVTQKIQIKEEQVALVGKMTCKVPCEFSKASTENEKESSINDHHETTSAKSVSSKSAITSSKEEASVVKSEEQNTSTMPIVYSASPTEYPKISEKKTDRPEYDIFGKTACSSTSSNDREQTKFLDHFVKKAEQLSVIKVDKLTVSCATTTHKCSDLMEATLLPIQYPNHESQIHAEGEKIMKKPNKEKPGLNSCEVKSPSDLTCVKDTNTTTNLLSKPKTNSIKVGEQFKSGDGVASANDISSLRNIKLPMTSETKETENVEPSGKQDMVQVDCASKTNEDSILQQHIDAHHVKTVENKSRIQGYQMSSKMEGKNELVSTKGNECSLLKELKQRKEEEQHSQITETKKVSQSKQEIRSTNYDSSPMVKTDAVTRSNNQQLQKDGDRQPDLENQAQMEKNFHEQTEIASKEIQQPKDGSIVNRKDYKPTNTESEKSPEESYTINVTTENKTEKMTSQTVQDKSAHIINPVPESHVIHIPSKEDNVPSDEPVIYSIRVSSKSDAVTEDEPVIYTICVSSISDSSMTDVPESQDKTSFAAKQLLTAGTEKEEETSGSKNEEIAIDCRESKASNSKEANGFFSTDQSQKETVDSPATKDKQDYYRSSEVDNISSSYESLLAKYGFALRENVHPKPEPKEQDEMQSKDNEKSTNNLPGSVQKTVDYDCAFTEKINTVVFCQESSKPNSPEVVPEVLKENEENKQCITQPITNVQLTQRHVGDLINSDIKDLKQFTSDNNRQQNEQSITANQKGLISKVVPTCKGNQATESTDSSKLNNVNECVEKKGKRQVGEKVCAIHFKRKEDQKEKENDNVQMTSEHDNHKNNPVAGITYTKTSNSTTVRGSSAHDNPLQSNSEISEKEHSKIKETVDGDVTQDHSFNRALKQDKGESKASQNRKEFVWKDAFSEPKQDKFRTRDETKDRRATGINSFSSKPVIKGHHSPSEDVLKKHGINMHQCLFKSQNITLEDKKIIKSELNKNKDFVIVQDNLSQQEKNKIDIVKAKGALAKNPLKVTGEKVLSSVGIKEASQKCDIQKVKRELAQVQKENMEVEITPVSKDISKKALYLLKGEKEIESNKDGINIKEPQCKEDEDAVAKVRKDDKQTKFMFGKMMVKDGVDSIRKETACSAEVLRVKLDDRTHVYQYHPGKGFLPETKITTCDERNSVSANNHDTMFTQTECTSPVLHKTNVIQGDKKSRPEISALADYARLRVISTEDDSTYEKDLLQKLDTYHKYNLTAMEPQKGYVPMSVGGTESKTVKKINENQDLTIKPLQELKRDQPFFQRNKFTKGVLEKHNQCTPRDETIALPKLSLLARRSDKKVFEIEEAGITNEKTSQIVSSTKTSLTEKRYRYQKGHENLQSHNPQVQHALRPQADGKNNDPAMLRQPLHAKVLEKDINPHVQNQESLPQMSNRSIHHKVNKQADIQNKVEPEVNYGEQVDELEYYTVTTKNSEPKSEEIHETIPFNNKLASKKGVVEIPTTRPQSNSFSPAMGKPTMFKVKDNTIRASSVSKAVKPRFHRSFSEEFRIGSPKEIWSSSEKSELHHDHEFNPNEAANPPVLHEPTVASHRLPKLRENKSNSNLSLADFTAAKEQRSYLRRSQGFEEDETQSVFSTVSEDVDSVAEGSVATTDGASLHVFEMKSNQDIYVRPESASYVRPQSACYVRPESACYERPESACSDMRPLGKPPTVLPKTEKALRRAKKLMTRKNIKVDTKTIPDSQGQLETKTIQTVSSLPSSPKELMPTNHVVHASPPISHYHVEPNYAPPGPRVVAHAFPMTQRKFLQDPNSGQYFMVDMPLQVKKKTFFDPETGKYVQLNVRQRTQSTHPQPQPVEVLNHPYVVYPGILPMTVSSLPTLRSSSQMSAPATLEEEQNKLEACKEQWNQETYQPSYHKNTHQYNNPLHATREKPGTESFYNGNNVNITQRHTDIITMSELEDFAMEST